MSDDSRQNFLNKIRVQKDLEQATGSLIERHGRGAELISKFAALDREDQDFIYRWAEIISESNDELAGHFINRAPSAFAAMDQTGVEAWLIAAMDQFDNQGLGMAIESLENLDEFSAVYASRHSSCLFDSVSTFLQHFVKGLGGRELMITTDPDTYTDTEKLFLPDSVNELDELDSNMALYKLTAVHLWAQSWYGTWRYQVVERLIRTPDPEALTAIFNRLECIRLDACIARDLPGLSRQLEKSAYRSAQDERDWDEWREDAAHLCDASATALDSIALIPKFMTRPLPALKRYQGEIHLQRVREAMFARIDREKAAMQQALAELQKALEQAGEGEEETTMNPKEMGEFSLAEDGETSAGGEVNFELSYDGDPVEMSPELEALLGSIMQDFGEVPDDHMEGINPSMYPDELDGDGGDGSTSNQVDEFTDAITYREWDYTRQRFREAFCLLNEFDVP
ncbi:MAG: hypothetical protein VCB59_08530, partial [Gammaproteobacteria bacterium]